MIFTDRYLFGMPVANHGTGIDQARHLMLQTGLQDVESAADIDAQIVLRIIKRKDGGGLAGDLENRIQASLKRSRHIFRIAHITRYIMRCGRHIGTRSGGFIVQDDDLVARRQQPVRHVATDKTGTARNQHPSTHANSSL